jgi:hypothetical protein
MVARDASKTSREKSFPHSLVRRLWILALLGAPVWITAPSARAQISPGPLSRAHQSLSGPTQCTSCHVVGRGAAELKCQECHREIAAEIASGQGLHSKFPDKEKCAACHSEHNGEEYPLIRWQPSLKGFDHSQTGYLLQGKHAGLECNQCHTPSHIQQSAKSLIKMKDLRNTFLGLSQECTTCHEDPHKGQLGANCTQCHNFVDWKAATNFDHTKTKFPLTGLHAKVPCAKCHTSETRGGPPRFSGIPFARCSDCHGDPHYGTFTQACDTCHTTSGWKKVAENERFDHSKTKFPLLGKHVEVDCAKCHANGNFKKPVTFAKCMDCHTPDPHGGQFADRADHGECASCHTVNGWKPSLFDVKAHAASAYPLEGKHATVACAKCHTPAGTATRYKIPFAKCTDCHSDVHAGQFAAAPYTGKCESCHTVHGFRPSTFTIAEHQKSGFPLKGSHLAVPCFECHTTDLGPPGSKIVPYHFANLACTSCHKNPHGDRFQAQMQQVKNGHPAGCEACHSEVSWTDLPSFDHSKTQFPLRGSHAKLACEQCHKPSGAEGKLNEASFKSTPTDCSSCHHDPHGGQFVKGEKPESCSTCHNTERWKPSTFDHETQTNFSLKGAHEKVACESCHTGSRMIDGKSVVVYKLAPRECSDCHD